MAKLISKRITEENIAKFGKVVLAPTGTPTSQGSNYKFWSDIAEYSIRGDTEIGICTVSRQLENSVSSVEQHKLTPEIIIPIDFPLILPLLSEGRPENEMEAFEVHPGEVVIINEGVWHAACLPAATPESSYFVIFRKNTPHTDVTKKSITAMTIESK